MPEDNGTQTATVETPQSVVKEDGSFTENWHEKYGKDNEAHLSRYKTFDSLVNSHIDTKKKFGKDPNTLVEIPTEHSSDEVRTAWSKARGRPDTNDLYEYALSDEMAIKLGPVNDKKMAAFREFAHKQDWNQKEFKEALDFYHANISDDIDAFDISYKEEKAADATACKTELRKKEGWRSEEEFNSKVQRAQSVMEKYGGVDVVADLNLENEPKLLVFLDNIAESMSEDTLKGLAPSSGTTKANIKTRIAENREQMDTIMKKDKVNYRNNPKFRELDKRNIELYKQMPV